VPDFFALKASSLRVAVELVEPIIEVRFRKFLVDKFAVPWYIAQSRDKRECLALFPNEDADKESLDPVVDGYEMVLYVVRSPREERIKSLIASGTRFRFIQWSDRFARLADEVLLNKLGPPPSPDDLRINGDH
jgi:hypothetical protein